MKDPFIIDSQGKVRDVRVVKYSFDFACNECNGKIPAIHETEYDELPGGADKRVRRSVTHSEARVVVQGNTTVFVCTNCRPTWHDRVMKGDDE